MRRHPFFAQVQFRARWICWIWSVNIKSAALDEQARNRRVDREIERRGYWLVIDCRGALALSSASATRA